MKSHDQLEINFQIWATSARGSTDLLFVTLLEGKGAL